VRGGGSGVQRETHLRRSFGVRRPVGCGGTAEVDRFEIADEIGRYDLDKFFHKHSLIGTKLCDGVLSPTRRSRGTELPGTLMGTDRTLFARVR